MNDSTSTLTTAAAARPTRWWHALWLAASAGPASPVLQAMAGPNGAPLWSGTSRLTDGLPPRLAADLYADDLDASDLGASDLYADDPAEATAGSSRPTAIVDADELCRAA